MRMNGPLFGQHLLAAGHGFNSRFRSILSALVLLFLAWPGRVSGQWIIGTWQSTLDLPESTSIFEVVGYGDALIAVGGANGSPQTWIGEVDAVSGEVLSWRPTLPSPQQCYYPDGIVVVDRYLVVADAGFSCIASLASNGDVLSWSLEPGVGYGSNGWGMAVASHGDSVYAIGGSDPNVAYTNVAHSQLDSSGHLATWESLVPLPYPANDPMAAVINGYLYLFGGEGVPPSGDLTHSRDVWRSPINSDGSIGSWQFVGLLLQARPHSNFLRYAGTLHVVAGGVHSYMTNTVESVLEEELGLTPNHVWATPLATVRNELGAAVVRHWGYVLGGNVNPYGGGETRAVYFTQLGPGNHLPVANAGGDQELLADASCSASVVLDGTGSYDPDGDALTYEWTSIVASLSGPNPTVEVGLGDYEFTLVVSDGGSSSEPDSVQVSVADAMPPEIGSASGFPNLLWPPNHKMVTVSISTASSDNCAAVPACSIQGVSSNEPVNGTGDGDTSPDWEIVDPDTVRLRAERSGNGDGRVYSVSVVCTDDAGNETEAVVDVTVPKHR